MRFTHLLVPTDLSDDAARAYAPAASLARRDGAKVTLLHVVEAARAVPHGAPLAAPLPLPGLDVLLADAEAQLARLRDAFVGVEVETVAVVAGEVGVAVDAEARTRGCDLIVCSTHGRSGFQRLVLGSVAEAILRHAHAPVLAIPPGP